MSWRCLKKFSKKPRLVGGGTLPRYTKNQFSKPPWFFNQFLTFKNISIRVLRARSLRDGSLSQRPLRDLCSLVFGATGLKETTKKITFEITMLDYPFGCWNQVNPTIFEICLLYENIDNQ